MHSIVCIKQVPDTTDVKLDPVTGSMIRSGVQSKINVYDLYALECAVRLRDKLGGRVTALSMGPPQAEVALREALTLGADCAVLASDMAFAGSDVLATSHTLAQCIRTLGAYDLILCGKQTTDGDTAQVGPALSEQLGIPHISNVLAVEFISPEGITVRQDLGDLVLTAGMGFPCLLTLEKGDLIPRLPSHNRKLSVADTQVQVLCLRDLQDTNPAHYGASGSATQVERTFPPEQNRDQVLLRGDADTLAAAALDALIQRRFL